MFKNFAKENRTTFKESPFSPESAVSLQKKKYRKLSIALKTVYRNGSFSMPKRKLLSGARENFLSRKKIRTHTPAKKGPRAIESFFLSRFRFFLKKLGNGLTAHFVFVPTSSFSRRADVFDGFVFCELCRVG